MQYFRDRDGCTIINALVERRRYDPDFARRLLDHALDRGADWPSRRVAVLALENQLLSLAGSTLPADQELQQYTKRRRCWCGSDSRRRLVRRAATTC